MSNAEPRETLTPWGKMSMAYFVANGSVGMQEPFAAPAWACTGCFACREACDHKNDVAGTLLDARAALVAENVAPPGARKAIARFPRIAERYARAVDELSARRASGPLRADAPDALVVGCTYAHAARSEAGDAVDATAALVGDARGVALARECCGLPLLHAGDAPGFRRQAEALARALRGKSRVIVADAGCAHALRVRYAEHGVALDAPVELVVELAARDLGRLRTLGATHAVRWHDPCHLGRGLGVYEAPRAVLTRALGRAPDEFADRRAHAWCSGGGGGLPVTMPETARAIADARARAHADEGGGHIVTGCASSLARMRAAGAKVDDIHAWIARALGV